MMDWDDDDEFDVAFEWDALHILHTYAWNIASGKLPQVSIVLGLNLIDAIKCENITEATAQPYIEAFMASADSGDGPKWD